MKGFTYNKDKVKKERVRLTTPEKLTIISIMISIIPVSLSLISFFKNQSTNTENKTSIVGEKSQIVIESKSKTIQETKNSCPATDGLKACIMGCIREIMTVKCTIRFINANDYAAYFDFHKMNYPDGVRSYISTSNGVYGESDIIYENNTIKNANDAFSQIRIPADGSAECQYVFSGVPDKETHISIWEIYVRKRHEDGISLDDGGTINLHDIEVAG